MTNLRKGLVGHWTMDDVDTSGGTIYDSSAYDNHGTLVNTPTTGVSGQVGEAYDFNNSNSEYVDGNIDVTAPCTYCMWINLDITNNTHLFNIADPNISGEREVGQILIRNGSPLEVFYSTTVDGTDLNEVSGLPSLNTGEWYHIVAVVEDSSTASVYINGELNSSTIAGSNYSSGYENDRITVNKDNQNNYADSQVDEVRVYNRALSANEVSSLYQMRSQRTQSDDLSKRLVGHWTMEAEDESDGMLSDSTAYGNNATLTSGPIMGSSTGIVSDGGDFTSDGSRLEISSSTSLQANGGITLSGWVKASTLDDYAAILEKGRDDEYALHARWGGSTPSFRLFNISSGEVSVRGGINLDDGNWHHLAGVYDGADMILYIDGSPDSTNNIGSVTFNQKGNPLFIGHEPSLPGSSDLRGYIDDVRVYDRFLSADEISRLYNKRQ